MRGQRRTGVRRGGAIALCAMARAVGFALSARSAGDGAPGRPRASASALRLPPGWHRIHTPITGVIYPRQVLAAATSRIVFRRRPRSCSPVLALRQLPKDGALLQIVEYSRTGSAGKQVGVPQLPPRPHRFSYADATHALFECAGPSYKFDFEQRGRAFQAQVWLNRRLVAPRVRERALRILDRFQPVG